MKKEKGGRECREERNGEGAKKEGGREREGR